MSLRADFRRAVERLAVPLQSFAAGIELSRDPAELAGGLVAELHQMLRDHRELGPAVVDALRQHFEQRFQRARFCPHGHH